MQGPLNILINLSSVIDHLACAYEAVRCTDTLYVWIRRFGAAIWGYAAKRGNRHLDDNGLFTYQARVVAPHQANVLFSAQKKGSRRNFSLY